MTGRWDIPQQGPTTIRLSRPGPWWATSPHTAAGTSGWFGTVAQPMPGGRWDARSDDAPTEVIRPVRLDDTGPLPAILVDPGPRPDPPPPARHGGGLAVLVRFLAVVVLVGAAFVAGQISTRTGAVPPPPMPAAAAEVITAAQMARIWPHVELADVRAQCDPWNRGAWREYVTDRWSAHLSSPAGGGIDVDRATVARFLDRACARRR